MLCELDTGKSTANSHQACREAVLNLGHRSGRARRTEATGWKVTASTLYRVEFAKDLRTDNDVAGYLLVPASGPSGPENGPKVRMNRQAY